MEVVALLHGCIAAAAAAAALAEMLEEPSSCTGYKRTWQHKVLLRCPPRQPLSPPLAIQCAQNATHCPL
eukprot:499555-Pelagomonas_calceolata.AAC.2